MAHIEHLCLEAILARLPTLRIAVIGDFFLDRYVVTDPSLSEISVETGLEARQVVQIRRSPGAAGTVTNNLSALGIGHINAYGVIGGDGEGFELRRALRETRVTTEGLLETDERFTPTYMKPMVLGEDGERELERLDVKNRTPLPAEFEERLIDVLYTALAGSDPPHAVIVADQVQERNCGIITDRIRDELSAMALAHPEVVFFADSRERIGEFRDIIIKPNRLEAARALDPARQHEPTIEEAEEIGRTLAERNGRHVFLTLGADGILVCPPSLQIRNPQSAIRYPTTRIPAPLVTGPIDICGAGDSATAGIVSALCAGASPEEAAALGNLCAAVTIRKLGTTGTASPDELRALAVGC